MNAWVLLERSDGVGIEAFLAVVRERRGLALAQAPGCEAAAAWAAMVPERWRSAGGCTGDDFPVPAASLPSAGAGDEDGGENQKPNSPNENENE